MRRPELTGAPRARVDELLAQTEEHFEAGDLRTALEWSLRAWDELPTPKASWDYYPQTLVVGFVEDYASLGDEAAVRQWIPTLFEVYDDAEQRNLYTLMVAGQSLLAIGDEPGATAVFRRILDLHGIQSFRGHDPAISSWRSTASPSASRFLQDPATPCGAHAPV